MSCLQVHASKGARPPAVQASTSTGKEPRLRSRLERDVDLVPGGLLLHALPAARQRVTNSLACGDSNAQYVRWSSACGQHL